LDRPPEERFNQRISEHAQLRGIAVRENGVASLAYGDEAIQRAPAGALKNARNSPLIPRFLFGALRAQLDCFASLAMTRPWRV
jgi:hypothetical protein